MPFGIQSKDEGVSFWSKVNSDERDFSESDQIIDQSKSKQGPVFFIKQELINPLSLEDTINHHVQVHVSQEICSAKKERKKLSAAMSATLPSAMSAAMPATLSATM